MTHIRCIILYAVKLDFYRAAPHSLYPSAIQSYISIYIYVQPECSKKAGLYLWIGLHVLAELQKGKPSGMNLCAFCWRYFNGQPLFGVHISSVCLPSKKPTADCIP